MPAKFRAITPALAIVLCAGCGTSNEETTEIAEATEGMLAADVWADNWFALSVNGEQVAEDSVPITTERSFNAESFTFPDERPFVLALTAKDYKEDDTGLEYIGTDRQQMGDGGVILQIRDAAGGVVAVTDASWKCLVTNTAPLNKVCADESDPQAGIGPCGFRNTDVPEGWDTLDFDDSEWPAATVHTEEAVSPKFGYDDVSWDAAAKLIWGPDLQTDNTVLCRAVVE